MNTLRFTIRPEEAASNHRAIRECAEILKRGGLVAIPTETVYGLAANALDADAVARIFVAKERPAWDPLIVHISDFGMVERVAEEFPLHIRTLAERFWPGPLTLLLKKSPQLPIAVTAGRDTVAVRMPAHAVARSLIASANVPLAAPSANRFGRTSPTTAEHVLRDLDGRIDAILDAGPTTIGVESTVLDALRAPPLILRPGGVTREELESVLGPIESYAGRQNLEAQGLASPGLADRHYAPQAKVVLVEGKQDALLQAVRKHVATEGEHGEYVGVMAPQDWLDADALANGGLVIFDWGAWEDWTQLAQNLFSGLRYLDKPGVSVILCPLPLEEGLGLALRDRLMRAAQ
jgi:L-threonylcarbamoyladenylate synthase